MEVILDFENRLLYSRVDGLEKKLEQSEKRNKKVEKVCRGLVEKIRDLEERLDVETYKNSVQYRLDPRLKEKYRPTTPAS